MAAILHEGMRLNKTTFPFSFCYKTDHKQVNKRAKLIKNMRNGQNRGSNHKRNVSKRHDRITIISNVLSSFFSLFFFFFFFSETGLKSRMELIKIHTIDVLQSLKSKAEDVYKDMDDWLGARFQSEMTRYGCVPQTPPHPFPSHFCPTVFEVQGRGCVQRHE